MTTQWCPQRRMTSPRPSASLEQNLDLSLDLLVPPLKFFAKSLQPVLSCFLWEKNLCEMRNEDCCLKTQTWFKSSLSMVWTHASYFILWASFFSPLNMGVMIAPALWWYWEFKWHNVCRIHTLIINNLALSLHCKCSKYVASYWQYFKSGQIPQ